MCFVSLMRVLLPLKVPMSCPHSFDSSVLRTPTADSQIYKDECTVCFDNTLSYEKGIDVCMTCFNGLSAHKCALHHFEQTRHPLYLRLRHVPKTVSEDSQTLHVEGVSTGKITRLAIGVDGGASLDRVEDKYSLVTSAFCYVCNCEMQTDLPPLKDVTERILHAHSASRKSDLEQWELKILPCEHTVMIVPEVTVERRNRLVNSRKKCDSCDLTTNLWLCLSCGVIGCGRSLWDGTGGNSHALEHFKTTGHPLVVKLGTIAAEQLADGTQSVVGDCYCYACDDATKDPELEAHVSLLGLDPRTERITEKSTTELELEQNLSLEFNRITEAGKHLVPLSGPGLTGLSNLGNSCYISSVLQVLFSLPAFQTSFNAESKQRNYVDGATDPRNQIIRMSEALSSGKWSGDTITPRLLKNCICKGHPDFGSASQQDAVEFLEYFSEKVDGLFGKDLSLSPVSCMRFALEDRLQCQNCSGVRYQQHTQIILPINEVQRSIPASVSSLFESETVEGFLCPHCQVPTCATKKLQLLSFPDFLLVQLKRFEVSAADWTVRKSDVEMVDVDELDISPLRAPGHGGVQPGETELPLMSTGSKNAAPRVMASPEIVASLLDMGFERRRCELAAVAVNNIDVASAFEWITEHLDDSLDEDSQETSTTSVAPSAAIVSELVQMGFSDSRCKRAALAVGNKDMQSALEWVFSTIDDPSLDLPLPEASVPSSAKRPKLGDGRDLGVTEGLSGKYRLCALISHMGKSTSSGHYVCHIKKNVDGQDRYVLFNDAKVALSESPPRDLAYVYVYERC
eukprot:ANDGO_07749.mRNA.1 Ubiquitin carboxyl-terminal hydrolase 14